MELIGPISETRMNSMIHFRTNVWLPCSAVNPCVVVVVLYLILYQEAMDTRFILSYLIMLHIFKILTMKNAKKLELGFT